MKKLIVLTLIVLSGCSTTDTVIKEPQSNPAPVTRPELTKVKALWDSLPSGKSYTEQTLKSLEQYGAGLLSQTSINDSAKYCPKFSKLTLDQKKQFYVYLISAIAWRESSFKPETNYTEDFKDGKGDLVVSRGLTQISMESANQKAYACNISKPTDLNKPDVNLTCTVKILNYWIPKDKSVGTDKLGAARYWSVMRSTSSSNQKIIAKMKELEICN